VKYDTENWSNLNGLLLPNSVLLAKRSEMKRDATTERGKFFSSYAWTQNNVGSGYNKPANTMSFETLRGYKDKSLIDIIIIGARVLQMKHIAKRVTVPGKQIGFRVVHENHADPNFKPDKATINRCKEMEKIIDNVNTDIHPGGFRDFASIAVDQELTIDRKAMVVTKDRTGSPVRYHLVDGATIRPVLEIVFDYMKDKKIQSKVQAFEGIWKAFGVDLTNAAYVQVVDGHIVSSWTKDEMSIDIANPSIEINKWAYGRGSMLEQSISGTQTWLAAWGYNDGLFTQDSPESLLFLYGDYDPVGLDSFKRQILDQTGSGDYQKIPVIPADKDFKAELVKIRELPKDLQFAEFLRMIIQIKTASYRAHPSIVNMSIDKGSGGGISIGGSNEDEIVQNAHEEGFETLAENLCMWITRTIIKPRYDDLVMIMDLDKEDETKRVELLNKELEGAMTFNEWRRSIGLEGDLEFGDIPANQQYVTYAQNQQQNAQAQSQQDQTSAQQAETAKNSPTPKDEFEHTKDQANKQFSHQVKEADRAHELATKEHEVNAFVAKESAKTKADPQKVKGNLKKSEEKILVIEILN
jgi:hypothetical protein